LFPSVQLAIMISRFHGSLPSTSVKLNPVNHYQWLSLMIHPAFLIIYVLATLFLSACSQSSNEAQSQAVNPRMVASGDVVSQAGPANPLMEYLPYSPADSDLVISREEYLN